MFFLQIARHTPENCPMLNETAKKTLLGLSANLQAISRKHGIKVVRSWASTPEHTTFIVYDAPKSDVMIKFMKEPEIAAWQEYEDITIKPMLFV